MVMIVDNVNGDSEKLLFYIDKIQKQNKTKQQNLNIQMVAIITTIITRRNYVKSVKENS